MDCIEQARHGLVKPRNHPIQVRRLHHGIILAAMSTGTQPARAKTYGSASVRSSAGDLQLTLEDIDQGVDNSPCLLLGVHALPPCERVANGLDQWRVLIAPRLQALKQFRLGRLIHAEHYRAAANVHSSAATSALSRGLGSGADIPTPGTRAGHAQNRSSLRRPGRVLSLTTGLSTQFDVGVGERTAPPVVAHRASERRPCRGWRTYDRDMQARAAPLHLPALALDIFLALFIAVMQVQGTLAKVAADPESVLRPLADLGYLGYILLIVSGAVVALRRQFPVAVFAITALASLIYYTLDFPDGPGWLGLFVAVYSLTAYGDGRRSVVLAAAGITVLTVGWLIAAADIEPPAAIGWVFFRIGASVMSAALGESVRTRRVIAADALERAELAERTREQEARARVDEERLRIAREVHDTVAHALAVITVQSGVTAHVLDRRPDRAREALEAIARTSSEALQDMRAVLGVLRDTDDARSPHPGLGRIGELTARA